MKKYFYTFIGVVLYLILAFLRFVDTQGYRKLHTWKERREIDCENMQLVKLYIHHGFEFWKLHEAMEGEEQQKFLTWLDHKQTDTSISPHVRSIMDRLQQRILIQKSPEFKDLIHNL